MSNIMDPIPDTPSPPGPAVGDGRTGQSGPVTDDRTPSSTSRRRVVALVLFAALGLYVSQLTLSTALSLRIATVAPEAKEVSYGLAASTSSLLLLFAVPLFGALSDRTASRFGRRRPWILGGLLPCLAATALIGSTASIPVVVGAYIVAVLAMNASFIAFTAVPVEGVPDSMRARVMGLMGTFGALAMTGGTYLAAALVGHQLLLMTAPVLIALVCSLPLLVGYADPALDRSQVPSFKPGEMARSFIVDPRKHPNFGWDWLSRFLAGVAMAGMFSFFIFFLVDGIGLPLPEAGAKAGFLSLVSAPFGIATFVLSGIVSDRVGRRKPFVAVAALLMAAALLLAANADSFNVFLVAWVLFGVGQAMYLTVDLALCAAVLPDVKDTGKDMAVFSVALSLPNAIVPAAAPAILAVGGGHNYSLLFSVCAGLCALGAGVVYFIRGVR